MKSGLLLASVLTLAACDKVVKTENIGEPYETVASWGCTHPGFCMSCGPNFGLDGKFSSTCRFGFHTWCPGTKTVAVEVQPQRRTHESGKVSTYDNVTWLRDMTSCF